MIKDTLGVLRTLNLQEGVGSYYSLPALDELGVGVVNRLPVCIRVVLESLLRNCDGETVTQEDVRALANWNASEPSDRE
ncbi:MAG: hypothetical protein HN548_05380, partial [Opitutae bacterium]|nr:hypothetical protein [Opitutae bacterium]